jgi:hypothetical protein
LPGGTVTETDRLAARHAGPGHYILMSLSRQGARALRALNEFRVASLRQLIDAPPPGRRKAMTTQLTELARRATEADDVW